MLTDEDGREIREGDKLSFSVGIPPREVTVTVVRSRNRLVVTNDEGTMSLRECLKWYNCWVVSEPDK